MSVADYFSVCLGDLDLGYYRTRDPFGAAGDFTTAPEISQLFGEIIGICLLLAWQAHDRQGNVRLVEIGPGRGTLMADVQRVIQNLEPDLAAAASAHLVETSEHLAEAQKKTLKNSAITNHWHTNLDEIASGFTLLFNNELFDAIPIRQFICTDQGWRERTIVLGAGGNLEFQAGPAAITTPPWATDTPIGEIAEIAPAREALMARMSARLLREGGIALAIDYGHVRSATGDTLQAVSRHEYVDVLANPGECDLTSHVDFEALGNAARSEGAHVWPVMTQGDFLLSLGLLERAGALGADKSSGTQHKIRQSVERLAGTGSSEMGNLFKVLCVAGSATPITPFSGNIE
ncbi:MAG: class I SAM-dependent methyltransferase [Hyphomicrobiales bacterium]|nr:class I SAM-dependent methyltransferase [Hyphomicrobiales bacterium]MCP4999388.1 class I SAM-dependent methyltransferase [Hyphomicrobiales bacterium]